jgi:hypothetical protein
MDSSKELDRSSYIIKDSKNERALGIFSDKIGSGMKGLCITRANPAEIERMYNLEVPYIWLNSSEVKGNPKFIATSDIGILNNHVLNFLEENPHSVVLLDRLDYLISMHGFNSVLKFIYSVNDAVHGNNSTLMLNINPDILSEKELSLVEQEFYELQKARLESDLQDDLHEILLFVNSSPQRVSFKDVSKKFSITKTTTRKRINRLIDLGLAAVKKNGRNKIIRSTDLGKGAL